MSDGRLAEAQEALAQGRIQEAMGILKGILQGAPDDLEVRGLLTECQARMMLQLQVSEKIKKAKVLFEQGLRENAEKVLGEVLRVDPENREALDLLHPLPGVGGAEATGSFPVDDFELPPPPDLPPLGEVDVHDATATDDFSVGALPAFDQAPSSGFALGVDSLPELTPLESLDMQDAFGGAEATVLSAPGPGPGAAEQAKIREYIEEGRALQAGGRVQEAVDTWARVFILDEENREAQELIDSARAGVSGNQVEIEHALAEGIAAFNSGQPDRARPLLEKVLDAFPGHKEARYYLDRMVQAPQAPQAPPVPMPSAALGGGFELEGDFESPPPPQPPPPPIFSAPPSPVFAPPPPPQATAVPSPFGPPPKPASSSGGPGEFEFDTGADAGGLLGAPSPPPAGTPALSGVAWPPPELEPPPFPPSAPEELSPAAMAPKGASKAASKSGPSLALILGGAGAVLLLAVGILVVMKFTGGDGDTDSPPPVASRPGTVKNTNAPANPSSAPVGGSPGGAAPVTAADFVREARAAMEVKDYARALGFYQQALLKEKDNGEALAGLEQARTLQVQRDQEEARNQKFIRDYTYAVNAYRDGEYKDALTVAWRLIYPDDKLAQELGKAAAIRRLIRDGYYNWAVKDLKVGNPKDAEKNLNEALTVDSTDAGARSLLQFAGRYSQDAPDALYWETVKTQPLRPFSEGP